MNLTIRQMQLEDIQQVQHIAKASWHATYEGIIPRSIQDKFLAAAYSEERLSQRMQQSIVYVAEYDGILCGFANYSPVNTSGQSELIAIYLLPITQGNGVGSALLQQAIQNFRGLKEIHLNVEHDNTIGMNFYKAKGFQIIKQFEENFEGHILHTVQMILKL